MFEMGSELGHRMHILDLGGGFPGIEGAKVRFEEVTLDPGAACGTLWGDSEGQGGCRDCGGSHMMVVCVLCYPWFISLLHLVLLLSKLKPKEATHFLSPWQCRPPTNSA